MDNTYTTIYNLDGLIKLFNGSIEHMKKEAEEHPLIKDFCDGYAAACEEAIIRIKNHVVNI